MIHFLRFLLLRFSLAFLALAALAFILRFSHAISFASEIANLTIISPVIGLISTMLLLTPFPAVLIVHFLQNQEGANIVFFPCKRLTVYSNH